MITTNTSTSESALHAPENNPKDNKYEIKTRDQGTLTACSHTFQGGPLSSEEEFNIQIHIGKCKVVVKGKGRFEITGGDGFGVTSLTFN